MLVSSGYFQSAAERYHNRSHLNHKTGRLSLIVAAPHAVSSEDTGCEPQVVSVKPDAHNRPP